MASGASRARQVTGPDDAARDAALVARAAARHVRGEPGLARVYQIAHRALGGDARLARRADAQMGVDELPIGHGQLAVDVGRHERIDGLTVRH